MKKLLITALIVCAIPASALAHPGKTDKYGGHKCYRGCEDWKLLYAEYHLHDKDGRPIRVSKKTAKSKAPKPEYSEPQSGPVEQPKQETVTITKYVTVVREESVFTSNPLLFILLALLFLLLILRLSRRKETENNLVK